MKHQRQSIIFKIHDELSQRLALSIQQRDDLILSRNEDTKSSAADKYETSREMVQQEIDHIESQIFNQKLLLQELKEIRMSKISDSIQKGSIIETEKSLFFLGIGLGKTVTDDSEIFAISLASPLGQLFIGKKAGDEVALGNNSHKVVAVY